MLPGCSKLGWNKHHSNLDLRFFRIEGGVVNVRAAACPDTAKTLQSRGPILVLLRVTKQARGRVRCSRFTCDAVSSSKHWPCSLVLTVVQPGTTTEKGSWSVPPCCACITKQQPSLEAGRDPELPRLRFLLRLQPPHIGTWFWQPLKLARAPPGPGAGQKDPRSATRNRTMRQATAHRHTQQMSAFGTRLAQSCEIEALLFEKTNVAESWRLVGRVERPIWPVHENTPWPMLWDMGTRGRGFGSP